MTDVFHTRPGFRHRQVVALLQELNRDIVWAAHKRHAALARRAIDRDAIVHEMLAGGIYIFHLIGQMSKMPAV